MLYQLSYACELVFFDSTKNSLFLPLKKISPGIASEAPPIQLGRLELLQLVQANLEIVHLAVFIERLFTFAAQK